MAYTRSVLVSNQSATDGTSATTASISPPAGALILAWIAVDRNAADASTVTLSGGGITTWTLVDNAAFDGSSTARLHLFRALEASPGSGTVTIDCGGVSHQHFYWKIVAYDEDVDGLPQGNNGGDAIVQVKKATFGTSATPSLTFDAATNAANTLAACCIRTAAATSITGPTSWTTTGSDISNATSPTGYMRLVHFDGADDTTDWTIGGSPTTHAIIQVEIEKASTAGPGPTIYFLGTATGDGWGDVQLGGTAPSTTTTSTGWTVAGTAADNYSEMAFGSERAANTFSATVAPGASPNNTLKNGWRYGPTSGVHSAGDWPISIAVRAVDAGGTQDGAVRVRMFRSANADGSSSTELTGAAVQLSTVTNLTTAADQNCTGTLSSIPEIAAGQYVFFCCAWRITGQAS